MKRLLALLLSVLMILSLLAGCGTDGGSDDDDEDERPKVTTGAKKDTGKEEPSEEPDDPSDEQTDPTQNPTDDTEKPDVDEPVENTPIGEVLFDEDGIQVVYQGLETGFSGEYLKLDIINNSDEGIIFESDVLVVNGFSVSVFCYATVDANDSAEEVVTISEDDLEYLDIATINSIGIYEAVIKSQESYDELHKVSYQLVIDGSGDLEQEVDISGETLVYQTDLTVIAKGVKDTYMGKSLLLLIINDSDEVMKINVDNLSVNGFTCDVFQSDYIVPGTAGICDVEIYESSLHEQGVTEIEEITFDLKAYFDSDTVRNCLGLELKNVEGDVIVEPGEDETESSAMGATLDSAVVYNQDDVVVTVVGLEGETTNPALKLFLENNSSANLYFSLDALIINGFYIDVYESIDAAAGKKANGSISIPLDELERAGIETIATITFVNARLIDNESFRTLGKIACDLVTSVGADYAQDVDLSGQELVNQDDLRILYKEVEVDDYYTNIILLVENGGEVEISVDLVELTINGIVVEDFMYSSVSAGTYRYLVLDLYNFSLEADGITDIQEITIQLEVLNHETYRSILTTDAISLEL